LAVLALALATAAPDARAADSLFWTNFDGNSIASANLEGGGGGTLSLPGATVNGPQGIVFDLAAGRLYWANYSSDDIWSANLDGSGAARLSTGGAEVASPFGIDIDPGAGRVYWANPSGGGGPGSISYANVDGSGGGQLNTGAATVQHPIGVAVDPAAGRIYWANYNGNTISFALLDGSGGGDLNTIGATVERPEGVAIDPVDDRIYWANQFSDTISWASLAGTGGGNLAIGSAPISSPSGVGIDPIARKVYWANQSSNSISWAYLTGAGGSPFDFGSAPVANPRFPTLMVAPRATGPAAISGGAAGPNTLSCFPPSWAGDVIASHFYRAPSSVTYRWTRDGLPIAGDSPTLSATIGGTYRCTVTASNPAGSSSVQSDGATLTYGPAAAPLAVAPAPRRPTIKLVKIKRNKRRGIATLLVSVSGPGTVTLTGRGIVKQTRSSSGAEVVKLPVRAKGPARRHLRKAGQARVRARLAFAPHVGSRVTATARIKLIIRHGKRR
jgi:hypothetical protein